MGKYWIFKNNWAYTLIMVFLVQNIIFQTKLMQTGDKAIIRSMIDVDQTIAGLNVTSETVGAYMEDTFGFTQEVMLGKFLTTLISAYYKSFM